MFDDAHMGGCTRSSFWNIIGGIIHICRRSRHRRCRGILTGTHDAQSLRLLPVMKNRYCFCGRARKSLIIDAKYYGQIMQRNFDKPSLRSAHLYQFTPTSAMRTGSIPEMCQVCSCTRKRRKSSCRTACTTWAENHIGAVAGSQPRFFENRGAARCYRSPVLRERGRMRSGDTSNKKLQLCRLDKAGAHVIIKIERTLLQQPDPC